jgi:hypothetical protein
MEFEILLRKFCDYLITIAEIQKKVEEKQIFVLEDHTLEPLDIFKRLLISGHSLMCDNSMYSNDYESHPV